ncbi:MAG: leucine-rich repeat protein [Paludibacteraceae bacterium]|nr:leucine-rich repeat protein [Paludibacteraceae bacterium]
MFYGCTKLSNFTIPLGVYTIEDYAFAECNSINKLIIPKNVYHIGTFAFNTDSCITEVIIEDSEWNLYVENGNNSMRPTYVYIGRVVNGSNILGWGYKGLKKVTLGSKINGNNLPISSYIEEIYSNIVDPTPITQFSNKIYINCKLYIPQGTLDKYQSTKGWKEFFQIIEDPSLGNETSDVKQTNADNPTVKISNGQVSVSGMEDKTLVSVFDINGTHLGSTYSSNGNAVIRTNLPQNTLVIIKIGNKSFKTIMR